MDINQVYDIVNTATREALGDEVVLKEDLSNIVDIGNAVFNANAKERYSDALLNRIGKTIFVNRIYEGSAPSVMMDAWEYGSVLQKVCTGLPEATENETWELQDGQSYDPNVFHQPKGVIAKFYNKRVTFEIDMSFTEEQLKESFLSATQLNAFISMLYTSVENSMTVKIDELIRRTINNMIGETIDDEYKGAELDTKSGVKAVNLLYLYNKEFGTELTAQKAMKDKDFIRFASFYIKLVNTRMRTMSTTFNIGKQPRFTPNDMRHLVLLEDFASSADIYLQSNTFHDELSKLPYAETVAYWQGSGTEWQDVGKVDIKTSSGADVKVDNVIGVMFDRYALGVSNIKRNTTSDYNKKAEFFTNFYKYRAGYFNDLNENFVVFFIA